MGNKKKKTNRSIDYLMEIRNHLIILITEIDKRIDIIDRDANGRR